MDHVIEKIKSSNPKILKILRSGKMTLACVAAIDQGTSSTRVLIFSATGKILGSHQMEHTQHYPLAGQVEHDPLEIWKNVKICMSKALSKIKEKVQVVGIGITNQRETTVVWNKDTGEPYHRAIVWNDTRTNKISHDLAEKFGSKDFFREKTGLPIASYFSATKLLYILDSDPDIRKDTLAGKALFGTIDTWLIWRLTNGKVHATDVTNASRTMLMDLRTLNWDPEILQTLGIPRQMLPEIHPSAHIFGHVDAFVEDIGRNLIEHHIPKCDLDGFECYHTVPIAGVIGDQNAALFGQTCFEKGQAKCTFGTGAFLLMNTGTEIVRSRNGLLTTVAYQLSPSLTPEPIYALEGSVAYSGSLVQWLRDNLQMITEAKETETIAATVPDNGGVYFVPAFAGLYAPYWREDARAAIVGLTAFNTKAHLVRAALEASAFQVEAVTAAMQSDSGTRITALQVDGGFSANSLIMQFQSDLLQMTLTKPAIVETTSLGAAFVAGLGSGMWSSLHDIHEIWKPEKQWQPRMPKQMRAKLLYQWKKALSRSLFWKDSATFTENGDVCLGDETDPFLEYLPTQAGAVVRHVLDHNQGTVPSSAPPPFDSRKVSNVDEVVQGGETHGRCRSPSVSSTATSAIKGKSPLGISKTIGLAGIAAGVGFAVGMLYQAGLLNK